MFCPTKRKSSSRSPTILRYKPTSSNLHHTLSPKEYIWSCVLNVQRRGRADGGDRGVFDGRGVGGCVVEDRSVFAWDMLLVAIFRVASCDFRVLMHGETRRVKVARHFSRRSDDNSPM